MRSSRFRGRANVVPVVDAEATLFEQFSQIADIAADTVEQRVEEPKVEQPLGQQPRQVNPQRAKTEPRQGS